MKKVLTVGVFDYFHIGHLRLFEQCRKYGDYLIVAVQESDYILMYKPNAQILYSTQERVELIKSLRTVDYVVTYTDVDDIVKKIDFDIFAVGEDQNHSGFKRAIDWCMKNNKQIARLRRTQGISSSDIKKEVINLY
ncbi:MAG: adenylyltransferase/cytidyltransferase family protein [Lachnospiraceae bacterium]|nr:adenylyltransferase/cytidyltransferase family protein [Lachnospiraceae bacterium]